MSDTTNPTAPTIMRMTPMVWMLKCADDTVVAKRRMAPMAKTTMLVPTPIAELLWFY
jgi:hypothetical protein